MARFARGLALAVIAAFAVAPAGARAGESGWERVSEDQGVLVDRRPAPGSALKEFRGRGAIDAPIARVLAVMLDVPRRTEWMARCTDSRLLEERGDTNVIYMRTDAPWPVDDRDLVAEGTLAVDADAGVARIDFHGVAHARAPDPPDAVRVSGLRGHWILWPERGRTRVEYQVFVNPRGQLPEWLVNIASRELPRRTILGLRRQVARRTYPEVERRLETSVLRVLLARQTAP